jgi:hypothetical protein
MDEVRSCPVCGRQGIHAQSAACPQCDADLLCFQALDSLAQNPAPNSAQSPRPLLALSLILLFLLFILGGLLLHTKKQVEFLDQNLAVLQSQSPALAEEPPVLVQEQQGQEEPEYPTRTPLTLSNVYKVDAQIKIVNTWEEYDHMQPDPLPEETEQEEEEVPSLHPGKLKLAVAAEPEPVLEVPQNTVPPQVQAKKNIVLLQGQPKRRIQVPQDTKLRAAAPPQSTRPAPVPKKATLVYQTQGGESLRQLAARFYGDERYYPVLMEQNPQLPSFGSLRKETLVQVFADKRQAQAVYQRKIEQREGLMLWNYEVQQGETWRSIYARFFPPRYSGRVFYAKNPEIIPGKSVQIILR